MSDVVSRVARRLGHEAIVAWKMARSPSEIAFREIVVPLSQTPQISAARQAIYRQSFERGEIDAALALVRPEDRVLELGAGSGIVAAVVSKTLGDSSRYLAYEANSDLEPSFRAIMARNGLGPRLHVAAIAQQDGIADFFIERDFRSSSRDKRSETGSRRSVPTHSFERVVGEFKPTVLLFDIEGAEKDILLGSMPPSLRAISGELHPSIVGHEVTTAIIINLLKQGFLARIDLSQGRVMSFERS